MFNDATVSSTFIKEGRAFVHQTSVTLYASPSSDAEVIVRLAEGAPVDVVSGQAEEHTGRLAVQSPDGHNGFVRANTKLITREQLLSDRVALQRSSKMGLSQMAIGSVVCLCGVSATIGTYLLSEKYKMTNTIYIFYGAVIVGGGQFFWGMEQASSSRHTLKKFDALWQSALA